MESVHVHDLAKNWWMLLLRGLAAILFGILAIAWPGKTLLVLIIMYGAYALVDGVLALGHAIAGGAPAPRWWLILEGIVSLGAAAATFFYPGLTALILVMFIGFWSIAHGVLEIIGAIQLRKVIDNEWLLIIGGLLSIAFGTLILVQPGEGALALVWIIGIYAMVFGALLVGVSLRLRSHATAA